MTAPRTVTVHTSDHGDVTTSCPAWCIGRHPAGYPLADLTHTGPLADLSFPLNDRGDEGTTLLACLQQRPYTAQPGPMVAVEIEDGWHLMGPARLEQLAAALVDYAGQLQTLARQVADLAGGERP